MIRRNNLVEWRFYCEVSKYSLAYVDDEETNTYFPYTTTIEKGHKSLAVTRAFGQRYPYCEVCSME